MYSFILNVMFPHCSWSYIYIYRSSRYLYCYINPTLQSQQNYQKPLRFVEFNPINEFTVWRASPLAVDRHRQMLDRLGTGQTKVDIFTWQKLGKTW